MKKNILVLIILFSFLGIVQAESKFTKFTREYINSRSSLGYGYSTAGLGGNFGFSVGRNEGFGFKGGFFVGLGLWPSFIIDEFIEPSVEIAVGARALIGNESHNLVLDLAYGTIAVVAQAYSDGSSEQETFLGTTVGVGYQYSSKRKKTFTATVGYSFLGAGDEINTETGIPTFSITFVLRV